MKPLRAPSRLEARILEERSAIEGERKQVTVMYADIVGSMELTGSLEAERWGFVLDRFLSIAADAVHAFEGTVNQFTGDGLLAVFGAPLGHEDHARRACLAVLQLQREVAGLADELARGEGAGFAIRCGLNSGEVVVGAIGHDVHMDFVPIGNTTALGKRIESLAPPGSAALSAATAALVDGEFELRELGEFEVKGAAGRHRVLELVGPGPARTRLQAVAATRGLSRFVGRDAELARLEAALAQGGATVGIVGDAGVGKSRLVHEFAAGCAERGVPVASAAAVAHGRYIPLFPVLALCRDLLDIDESVDPEVARERIEASVPGSPEDLALVFEFLGVPDPDRPPGGGDPRARQRRLLRLLATAVRERHTAVLVVEDLHWIDRASARFLDRLAGAVAGTGALLIGTFRPEHEAAWVRERIALSPLDGRETDDLLGHLLGGHASVGGLDAMIGARSGGNPFFVEELVQALAENGHLVGARGDYRLVAELEGVVLPATIQAGLAARIDRLPAVEKALVQTMSVIGTEIPERLLDEVADLGAGELTEALDALVRAQWVVPAGAGDSRGLGFKHPLAQEVAYNSLLSERRRRAHRVVAAAIERTCPEALDERAALLAHHCEAAGDLAAAAVWHRRAALWAGRSSFPDSLRHWRRVRLIAAELEEGPERDTLADEARIGVLDMTWRVGMPRGEAEALRAGPAPAVAETRMGLMTAGTLMHSGHERKGLDGFREVRRRAVVAGDAGAVLTATIGVAYGSWIAGSLQEGLEALDEALALADGDPLTGSGLVFGCPLAQAHKDRAQCLGYMGRLEAARAESDRGIALAREHEDPETECAAHASRAVLEAEAGDPAVALRHAALGFAMAERAGNVVNEVACSAPGAQAHVSQGRYAEALARAEDDLATIRRQRTGLYFEPLLLAVVARSRLALGDAAGAVRAAEEGVDVMRTRGLAACALSAPMALSEVLLATEGAACRDEVGRVLAEAARVADASGARVFELQLR